MRLKNSNTDEYKKALDYALRLLSFKDRSEEDIRHRLGQRGYSEQTIKKVVDRLHSYGYIDEEKLLEKLIKVALDEKNYGKHSIKAFLVSKGIKDELVSGLNISDDDYIKSAERFIEKKKRHIKSLNDRESKKRLIQMLMRRGHDIKTIKTALRIDEEIDG